MFIKSGQRLREWKRRKEAAHVEDERETSGVQTTSIEMGRETT
jgi:hypothetical protein